MSLTLKTIDLINFERNVDSYKFSVSVNTNFLNFSFSIKVKENIDNVKLSNLIDCTMFVDKPVDYERSESIIKSFENTYDFILYPNSISGKYIEMFIDSNEFESIEEIYQFLIDSFFNTFQFKIYFYNFVFLNFLYNNKKFDFVKTEEQ